MDNSRELARLLRKAQDIHLAKTQPPLWLVTGVFEGEQVPEPPDGVATYEPWIVIHIETAGLKGSSNRWYARTSTSPTTC